jgi:pyruvate formate lyase activating enzyme
VCVAHLDPVLETLEYLRRETDVWFEITTLLIPGKNDSDEEMDGLTSWVAEHLGSDVPLHFTAFHPDFNDSDRPADRDAGRSEAAVGQQSRLGCGEQSRKLRYGAWRSR